MPAKINEKSRMLKVIKYAYSVYAAGRGDRTMRFGAPLEMRRMEIPP